MRRFSPFLLALLSMVVAAAATDAPPTIKCPSPNGRFTLRISEPKGEEPANPTVELIEKESGKVMIDLGTAYRSHRDETVLVWSADSKHVAYATRGNKEGEVRVYFWNGSAFEAAELPENLPSPAIKFGKGANDGVKNYGGAPTPLRWLKSGELEVANDLMMLSRGDGKSYTGVVVFTLAFDKQHRATVHHVGKSKTTVDE